MVVAAGAAISILSETARRLYTNVKVMMLQKELCGNSIPETQIVYEEGCGAAQLLEGKGHFRNISPQRKVFPPIAGYVIPALDRYVSMSFGDPRLELSPLFVGRLTTKLGYERIVVVAYGRDFDGFTYLYTWTAAPETFMGEMETLGGAGESCSCRTNQPIRNLKVFAGQRDSSNSSHFTIRYECNGIAGVLDGWIDDNGYNVSIHRRSPSNGVGWPDWSSQ